MTYIYMTYIIYIIYNDLYIYIYIMTKMFCYILVRTSLQDVTESVQAVVILAVIVSIVVVGAPTRYALLHSERERDLKDTQMNVQHSLMRELILH